MALDGQIDLFGLQSSATISDCGLYRYALWRTWDNTAPSVLFIGLNPSTADEQTDDNTIRRCRQFAIDWGYGSLCMANLFALRATKPKNMKAHPRPVGDDNDRYLTELAAGADAVVCAWGAQGHFQKRDMHVLSLLSQYSLYCLGTTADGSPRHPLFVSGNTPLQRYIPDQTNEIGTV